MYSLSDLRQGLTSPESTLRELNRLCHSRGRQYDHNPNGINVFDEDWDNLVILDACRYDYFAEQSTLPGHLEYRRSMGGNTREFVGANFRDRRLHDTVYVTANSWYLRLREDIGAELHKVIDLHMGDEDGEYHDDQFNIVPPEVLTSHAIRAAQEYPKKRLLVHYIQPHHPFLGPTGREYFNYPSSSLTEVIEKATDATVEDVRRAYRENLDIVLESVGELVAELPGKTVVSADHGEMLGDRHAYLPFRDFGHHRGVYNDVLTKVPWQVVETGSRKRIVPEPPREGLQEVNVEQLERRLEDLGYKM